MDGKQSRPMTILRAIPSLLGWLLLTGWADALTAAKSYPGDVSYPSNVEWQALNNTLNGGLITPALPGSKVCYGPLANETTCSSASHVHAFDEPTLVEYNWWTDFACSPSYSPKDASCNLSAYPVYVVKALSAQDVAVAVKFASKHNLRVVVKNTGHDFLGKSVGAGALSIWTRNLRGITFTDAWRGNASQPAVTLGAGTPFTELYRAAYAKHRFIVGGTTGTVGAAGGWLQGGGHSMLSNTHGLGVDQVLEFEAVTPSGDIVTASDAQNPDLFWALRGGGGSTYAIVTRATVKTYPETLLHCLEFDMSPLVRSGPETPEALARASANFTKATAWLLSRAPAMASFGLTGYPILKPNSYSSTFCAPGRERTEIDGFWKHMLAHMKDTFGVLAYDSVVESRNAINMLGSGVFPQSVLGASKTGRSNAIQASRLIGEKGLANVTALEVLLTKLFAANYNLEPFIFGGAVQRNAKLDVGLNPAWRQSVMHLTILPRDGDGYARKADVIQAYERMQREHVPLIDALSVDSGVYINEGSFLEPDWRKSYFGGNYEGLLRVKRKYDPQNLLWCVTCVGSDVYRVGDDGKLYPNSDAISLP